MMYSSKAIVVKSIDYRESSKIVTALTEEHGKIAFLARGARKPKSPLSGKLAVGQMLEIVYYYKSTRSVQNIKEVSYWHRLSRIYTDLTKWAVVLATIETIQQLVQEGEDNPEIFKFLTNMLPWIEETDREPGLVFPYILLRIADIMGIGLQPGPQANNLSVSEWNSDDYTFYMNVEEGALSLETSGSYSYRLSQSQSRYILATLAGETRQIIKMSISSEELSELIRYIDSYMRYHIDDLKPRISDTIFQQIL